MKFIPEWDSIRRHSLPDWYDEAKLGIFIHWGAYSVPAWAKPTCALGDVPTDEGWFTNNPYAEWYLNSVRTGRGPTYEHHVKTYGADYSYENFIDGWHAERWEPARWAELFKRAGARYVIPTAKHHDGLCLWNSACTDCSTARRGPHRDVLRELSDAVRSAGLRFGVYYSGIIDWRFSRSPMLCSYDLHHPENVTYAYADYAYRQVMELIDEFRPSVLWNDIGWPYKGEADLPYLFAHYYNTVPEGVVNNRWNDLWRDFREREYNLAEQGACEKWECCRGLGLSFGYNQAEDERHLIANRDLISLLIQTVSENGNLLINVGPRADGTIPENQASRLLYLGDWMQVNGEAVYGTHPCPERKNGETLPGGETAYYTQKNGVRYLFLDHPRPGCSRLRLEGLGPAAAGAEPLGAWRAKAAADGDALVLDLDGIPADSPAVVLRLSGGRKPAG